MRRFIALAAAAVLAAGLLTGCGGGITGSSIKRPKVESEELQFQAPAEGDPIAIFNTGAGEVRAVLYPDQAPMAVENFTRLAQEGYYNGTSFHRIVSGFVVQGGDASGSGTTGSTIWNNNPYPKEISDQLHHYSGALCAAFSPDENVSGLSQFYFVQSLPEKLDGSLRTQMEEADVRTEVIEAYDAAGGLPYLDYTDTVFGQVYEGMDVVDTLAQSEVDENGKPVEDVLLNSVTISTYGAADPASASGSDGSDASSQAQSSSAAQSASQSASQAE